MSVAVVLPARTNTSYSTFDLRLKQLMTSIEIANVMSTSPMDGAEKDSEVSTELMISADSERSQLYMNTIKQANNQASNKSTKQAIDLNQLSAPS